jgi:hypothetical protein
MKGSPTSREYSLLNPPCGLQPQLYQPINYKNFEKSLPFVLKCISEADFIAIDTEFSGYQSSFSTFEHQYDSPEERYQKIRSAAEKFVAF